LGLKAAINDGKNGTSASNNGDATTLSADAMAGATDGAAGIAAGTSAAANKAAAKRRKLVNLSFGDEEEEEEEVTSSSSKRGRGRGRNNGRGKGTKDIKTTNGDEGDSTNGVRRIIKNPAVRTDFLPDRHREQAEQKQVEKLKEEWIKAQEIVKRELVQVTYSYWDGAGHRRTISIPKGSTIGRFLELVRQDLMKADFPELGKVSAANLMYVKEDIIIPHSYTFYDLIISKVS
jgi:protein FAM50